VKAGTSAAREPPAKRCTQVMPARGRRLWRRFHGGSRVRLPLGALLSTSAFVRNPTLTKSKWQRYPTVPVDLPQSGERRSRKVRRDWLNAQSILRCGPICVRDQCECVRPSPLSVVLRQPLVRSQNCPAGGREASTASIPAQSANRAVSSRGCRYVSFPFSIASVIPAGLDRACLTPAKEPRAGPPRRRLPCGVIQLLEPGHLTNRNAGRRPRRLSHHHRGAALAAARGR
jgi:hypothetical protein